MTFIGHPLSPVDFLPHGLREVLFKNLKGATVWPRSCINTLILNPDFFSFYVYYFISLSLLLGLSEGKDREICEYTNTCALIFYIYELVYLCIY